MAIKRPQLVNGEIYHIATRAIEGIELFRDKKDYLRMIHDLFEFNDENFVPSSFRVGYLRKKDNVTSSEAVTLMKSVGEMGKRKRKLLVEILTFCLMPNHVHLLLRQLREKGISKFMQKLGAYALYFNQRYKRKGHLFQGRYKIVPIKDNEQLKTVFVYIHSNPVSIVVPGWREKGIRNIKKVIRYLEDYRWSSYPDYLGKENFPSITSREFLIKVMRGKEGCREFVNGWLKFKKELANFEEVATE